MTDLIWTTSDLIWATSDLIWTTSDLIWTLILFGLGVNILNAKPRNQ